MGQYRRVTKRPLDSDLVSLPPISSLASERSGAFWIRYSPLQRESFDQVVRVASRLFPEAQDVYMVEHMVLEHTGSHGCRRCVSHPLDPRRVIDMLFWTFPTLDLQKVRCARKWYKQGAHGLVTHLERPESWEQRDDFFLSCIDQLPRGKCIVGETGCRQSLLQESGPLLAHHGDRRPKTRLQRRVENSMPCSDERR